MAGRRLWNAYLTAAASGPMSGYWQQRERLPHPIDCYPKALGRLEYTSADAKYLSDRWRQEHWEHRSPHEHHIIRFEPDFTEMMACFEELGEWFEKEAKDNTDFDGGEIVFSFSGHGRERDGTLFLRDGTYLSADDFVDACLAAHRKSGANATTRVALLLDSCYSGAFLLRVLERILHQHRNELSPEYMLASSMHDEVSWELPVLKHGLSTYCFSVRPDSIGSMTASASGTLVTWSIVGGVEGCSLITGGSQNPIKYDAYELECALGAVPVFIDNTSDRNVRTKEQWMADLLELRNELRDRLEPFRAKRSMPQSISDNEIKRISEELLSSDRGHHPST